MTRGKLRAITLAAVVVFSSMTVGVSITGSAVANHGTDAIVVAADGSGDYESIQAAVDHASAGDTIEIQSGTYDEQVNITKNLTVTASAGAVLTNSDNSGGFLESSFLVVKNGSTVELSGLTFEGPFSAANTAGIVVTEGAHLEASGLLMKQMYDDQGGLPSGAQYHHAILVGDVRYSESIGTTPATGSLTLTDSTIEEFGKAAVSASGDNTEVSIDNVVVNGSGVIGPDSSHSQPAPAQDSILIDGADVTLTNSEFNDIRYAGSFVAGTAVTIYGPSDHIEIRSNRFADVAKPISLQAFRDFDDTPGTIVGASIEDNVATRAYLGIDMFSESIASGTYVLNDSTIAGNTFRDGDTGIGVMTGAVSGVDVVNNVFRNNSLQLWQGDGTFDEQALLSGNDFDRVVDVENASDRNLYASIQAGIDNAGSGDTVTVGPGTYRDRDLVLDQPVTIDGAGMDRTVVDAENSTRSGKHHVFIVRSDNVTIRDLTMTDGHNTIRISSQAEVADFSLLNTRINDSDIGMYVAGANQDDNGEFNRVHFRNTHWIDNRRKGMYIEKLSNAVIEDTVIDGVTSDTYGFNNGIDINLKHDDYANITIRDTVVADVAKGSPYNGVDSFSAAIAIKARDDDGHPYYGPAEGTPASLDGVTLRNVTVRDSFNGLRFGEPGAVNENVTNVTLQGLTFRNNAGYHVQVEQDNLNFTELGFPEVASFDRASVVSSAQAVGRTIWASIQRGVNHASAGDTVAVAPGTYQESVVVNTSITLGGPGANVTTIESDGQTLTIAAPNVTVTGFTLRTSSSSADLVGLAGTGYELRENVLDASSGAVAAYGKADNGTIVNNTVVIAGTSSYGIRLGDVTGAVVSDNTFQQAAVPESSDNTPQAILLSSNADTVVAENRFQGPSSGQAVLVANNVGNSSNLTIVNNTVQGWANGVFLYENADEIFGVTIVGNHITGTTGFGVRAFDATGSDGFTDINREDNATAQARAVLGANNVSTVEIHGAFASSGPIVVAQDGSGDFESIQTAIDHANAGDKIIVKPGTYAEHVTVSVDGLTLRGPNAGTHGSEDSRGSEAVIEGQVVLSGNGTTLDGFVVTPPAPTTNARGEAIRISSSPDNVTVVNNIVRDFDGSGLPQWEGAGGIVAFGGDGADPIRNVVIADNKVVRINGRETKGGTAGISIQGHVVGAVVDHNVVTNIGEEATAWAFGVVVRGTGNHDETPRQVVIDGNLVRNVSSTPSDPDLFGVGLGIEGASGALQVTNNTFESNALQIEDKVGALNLQAVVLAQGNSFDRAAVAINTTAEPSAPVSDPHVRVWSSVQSAVDQAGPGHQVVVLPGTYDEHVTIEKSLTVVGPNAGTDARDLGNRSDEAVVGNASGAFTIQADNVTVAGFELTGVTEGAAAVVTSPDHAGYLIANNYIHGNTLGVLFRSDGDFESVVAKNRLEANDAASDTDVAKGLNTGFSDGGAGLHNAVIVDNAFIGHTAGQQSYAIQLINGEGHSDVVIGNNSMDSSVVLSDVDRLLVADNVVDMAADADSTSAVFVGGAVDNATIVENTFRNAERGLGVFDVFGGENGQINVTDNTFVNNTVHLRDQDGALDLQAVGPANAFDKLSVLARNDSLVHTIWGTASGAVDAAQPGDEVAILPGTYEENLVIDTPNVTVFGAEPGEGFAGPGVVTIDGRVDITADGVTLRAVTVTDGAPSSQGRIDGLLVSVQQDTAASVVIQDVVVRDLHNHGTEGPVEAIHVFGGSPTDGVAILNVTIRNVSQPASGADGIKVQAGVSNLVVRNTTITNVTGSWAYGVVATPSSDLSLGVPRNVVVERTRFSDITGLDYDGVGVGVDSASGEFTDTGVVPGHEVEVHNSSFTGLDYGVLNKDTGGNVTNATFNYWGAVTGPSGGVTSPNGNIANGDGVAVSENVTFVPYLAAPGGGPPAVSLNVTRLAFGNVSATPAGDNAATLAIEITSSGDLPVSLDAFDLTGAAPGQFEIVSGDATGTLAPLETRTVIVRYAPTTRADHTASLVFATSAPNQGTVSVGLFGSGVGPAVDVSTAEPVAFSAGVGGTATATITVTNEGDRPLSRTSASTVSGPYTVTSDLPATLAPGESADVTVEFAPGSGGIKAGTLTLFTNDSFAGEQTIRLRGEALAPALETSIADGTAIEFGTVAVGQTDSTDIIITNTGTDDLTISSVAADGDVDAAVGSTTVAPGGSTTLNVSLSPNAAGSLSGTVSLTTNASTHSWTVSGEAQTRTLDVQGSLDLGDTPVGSTTTAELTLSNTGDLPLTVDLSAGTDDSQFSLVGAPDQVTLGAGNSTTVTVAFSPSSTGAESATLTLASNDPSAPTTTVDLSGSGTESSLAIQGDSAVSFGPTAVDDPVTKTITIENNGTATVDSLSASLAGDTNAFTVSGVPSSLDPGATATVTVTYESPGVGDHRATLTVTGTDDGGSTTASASLVGTTVPPDVALNRSAVDLGFVATDGETATAAIEISNADTHGTELTVSAVDIVGPDAAAFSVVSQPDAAITSGDATVVVVRFDPDATGSHAAELQIDTNDPDEGTRVVQLAGTGAAPEATLSTSTLDFGGVVYGQTAERTVTVTNTGGADLEVTGLSVTGADADQVQITAGQVPATLVPGATATFTVSVTPTQTGSLDATVTVETDANDPSASVAVTPLVAQASATPSDGQTLEFGATRTGSATQTTVTVQNVGDAVLTLGAPSVSGADADAFQVVNAPGTTHVAPGESITYTVSFAPTVAGDATATLTFDRVSDPGVDTLEFALNGTATQADAQFSDASVSLGSVGVGETAETTLTLENEGSASFNVTDVAITGADSGAFDTDLASGTELAPGDSVTFTVNVTPSLRTSLSATLEVETDSPDGTLTSTLGATGIGPDIELATRSIEFGETRLGDATARTVVVNNTGNAPLEVTDVSLTGGETDQFVTLTESVVVPAKGSAAIELQFAPGTTPSDVDLAHQLEERSATLTIESNDTDAAEQSLDVGLSGVGITPAFERSPQSLQYGTVLVDTTTTRSVTLRNDIAGTADIEITGIEIGGPHADAYAVQGDPTGTVLAPGEEMTLPVAFTPTSPGAKFATLTVRTNDSRQDTKVVFLSNRNTVVRVNFGSVTMDYLDPLDGLQPEVDVYRGLNAPAQLDAVQVATTQDADFSLTLDGNDQAFSNAEQSAAFDSVRYLQATTNASFVDSDFQNASITFRVTKAALANAGVSRSAVALYHYDSATGSYERLSTEFVRETRTEYVFAAETTAFSEFSIGLGTPDLSIGSGSLSDTSVSTGDTVQVSVDVTNDGHASGQQTVSLEVDGTVTATKTVTVSAESSETVTFDATFDDAGTFTVSINGTTVDSVEVSEPDSGTGGQGSTGGSGGTGGDDEATATATPADTATATSSAGTATATPESSETATTTRTTATATERGSTESTTEAERTETATRTMTQPPTESPGQPGFGPLVTLLALVALAILAVVRTRRGN